MMSEQEQPQNIKPQYIEIHMEEFRGYSKEIDRLTAQNKLLKEGLELAKGGLTWAITHRGLVNEDGIFEDLKRQHRLVTETLKKCESEEAE